MIGEKRWDVAVIGAGAAGFMAAIQARRAGLEVLLLDGKEKIGAKILMSGGTRCNLTNLNVTEKDFQTQQPRILRAVLNAFSSERTVEFFKDLGIEVILEAGGKYFPSTHSGRSVLEAFLKEVNRLGIRLETSKKVEKIKFAAGNFLIQGQDFQFQASTVVLTTGGLSFPATGSDGKGYEIAKSFGHSLIPTSPSLTPLLTDDPEWQKLTGVSLPVRLTLWQDKKKKISYEGFFLFTHFGFSGPVVLNISRHWIRDKGTRLTANFLPSSKEEDLRNQILDETAKHPAQSLRRFLSKIFPERFVEVFLSKLQIDPEIVLNQFKRQEREKLLRAVFHFLLRITGDQGYSKAEVTAGGVDLTEVDKKTLESKKQPGLFFAGEILDVDGRIGGFNFQWAWSSGTVAARGVARFHSSNTPLYGRPVV